MIALHRFTKIVLFSLYFLILLAVSGKLFFEKSFDGAASWIFQKFHQTSQQTLVIGLSGPGISLSPLANDIDSRARLLHMYEPLVRVNANLQIEPALAVSYGSLDDFTWEFRLRPAVRFHDGTTLAVDDVLSSLQQAKENPASSVKDLVQNIEGVQKIDEQIFHVITSAPDPLLLQKLSSILVFKSRPSLSEDKQSNEPLGTGPYIKQNEDKNFLSLKRFEGYWGSAPAFQNVTIQTFRSKEEKIAALQNKSVDILVNVPPDTAKNFHFADFDLKALPSLEVNFLMFHFDKTFKSKSLRRAVALALNAAELSKLTQGFAVPVNQFVGSGIFGFDPSISTISPDIVAAQTLVKEVENFSRISTTLDLPKGLEVFGASVKNQLQKVGIDVTLQFLDASALSQKITKRQSEFYFFGWRTDLGDSGDFLTAVAHSPGQNFGQFNGGNYRNAEVDRLIEISQTTTEQNRRLEKLRQAMHKITVDDVIGVPLFAPELLYGVSTDLNWKPRVDGYVLAQEAKL